MGLPQQLPARLLFILSTPLIIRRLYGTIYWFVSTLYSDNTWSQTLLSSPALYIKDLLLNIYFQLEMYFSVFLTIVLDYSEVVVYIGLLLFLYKLFIQLSITLKSLEKFTTNPVLWFYGYFRTKYVSRPRRQFSQYGVRKLFKRIFRG